eukprot:scaffold61646_cov62-Phaeocystis_antarctica.AAC.8
MTTSSSRPRPLASHLVPARPNAGSRGARARPPPHGVCSHRAMWGAPRPCTHPPCATHSKRAANAPATCTAAAHERSARSLSYAPDACSAAEWRMACATAFFNASSGLASLIRKVMNELRRSLGAKATPAWRLSTALTTSVQRRASSGAAWSTAPPPRAGLPSTKTYGLAVAVVVSPASASHACRSAPARRGGHGGGARAEDGRRLVGVGGAQVELEAAAAGRAGLEGDAQLELARHADPVGGHDREPREQRGVEEPHARAGPALLLLAQLVLTHGAGAGPALASLGAVRHLFSRFGAAPVQASWVSG